VKPAGLIKRSDTLKILYAVVSIVLIVSIPLLYSDLYNRILYSVFKDAFVSADVVAISPAYVSGVIKKIYVKPADKVKKGQMIVLIDDTMYKADLGKKLIRLKLASSKLKKLKKAGACDSDQECMELKEQVSLLKQDVRIARLMLSYTRIVSPIDGIVAKVAMHAGDTVSPSQVIMFLYNPSTLYIRAFIPVEDAYYFRDNMKVMIKLAGGKVITGKVVHIGGVDEFKVCNRGHPVVPVRIDVDKKQRAELHFGEPVRVMVK